MVLEGVAQDGVVGAQDILRFGVPQTLGEGGGALHVGNEDGVDGARHGRLRRRLLGTALVQEPCHGFHVRAIAPERGIDIAVQGNKAGVRD